MIFKLQFPVFSVPLWVHVFLCGHAPTLLIMFLWETPFKFQLGLLVPAGFSLLALKC